MITECGVYGANYFIPNNFAIMRSIISLNKLQHRGRESAGISYFDNDKLITFKNLGLVDNVFKNFKKNISVTQCIGHVRYSTSGLSKNIITNENNLYSEIQPFTFKNSSIVYNGNIKNLNEIGRKFGINDVKIDTELIIKILDKLQGSLGDKLIEFVKKVNGVYCLILLDKTGMYCVRDSYGVRPLSLGINSKGHFIASESVALTNCRIIRDIEPGEILLINKEGVKKLYHLKRSCNESCIFEYIYFMNKNSDFYGRSLEQIRYNIGKEIAKKEKIKFNPEMTYVIGCPETGIPYGKGYAKYLNLKYVQYLKKIENSGRTFILPKNNERIIACKKNLILSGDIKNCDIILIDDSLVRGNTLKNIIKTVREAGAKNVHIRITSPPLKNPCYFGIDIPTHNELIANNNTIPEIAKKIGADTLTYLDLNVIKMELDNEKNFCGACFDGNYNQELLDW